MPHSIPKDLRDANAPNLKPCPFCGGDEQDWRYIRDGRSLCCSECGAGFNRYNGPIGNTAEDRIAGAWNTRTDHSQALIAAAYEAAAGAVIVPVGPRIASTLGLQSREKIFSLTPADAQAALDKLIADAERRGMERAAGIARYAGAVQHPADGSYSHHDPVMGPDIEAAIRAAMKGTT
jgi:hypothetical protein